MRMLVGAALFCVMLLAQLHAHEIPVHQKISQAAVDYLVRFVNPAFAPLRDLIGHGAAAEDEDQFARPLFHFAPTLSAGSCRATIPSVTPAASNLESWGFTRGIRGGFDLFGFRQGSFSNSFTWEDALDHAGSNQGWLGGR